MPKIINGGLDQYGAEPFERQQFGSSGVEGVKSWRFKMQVAGYFRQNQALASKQVSKRNL